MADSTDKTQQRQVTPEAKPRQTYSDSWFNTDITDGNFSYADFKRGGAKKRRFVQVNFTGTFFEKSYFNHCEFDSCVFTGCRFDSVNFEGSVFSGCKFEYAVFDKTNIDEHVLVSEYPQAENLRMRFARAMRVNFAQTGNADGVNKAISIELAATRLYLWNAWTSKATYYRKKYKGLARAKKTIEWLRFKIMDLIWGNGESPARLFMTFIAGILAVALLDFLRSPVMDIASFQKSIANAPAIAFGFIVKGNHLSQIELVFITIIRLILFGLFMAIVVRRYSRR